MQWPIWKVEGLASRCWATSCRVGLESLHAYHTLNVCDTDEDLPGLGIKSDGIIREFRARRINTIELEGRLTIIMSSMGTPSPYPFRNFDFGLIRSTTSRRCQCFLCHLQSLLRPGASELSLALQSLRILLGNLCVITITC